MDGRRVRCPRHGFSRLVRVRIPSGMGILGGVVEALICPNVIRYYLALTRERLSNDDRVGGRRNRSPRHGLPRFLREQPPSGDGSADWCRGSLYMLWRHSLLPRADARGGGELSPSRWVLVREDGHDTQGFMCHEVQHKYLALRCNASVVCTSRRLAARHDNNPYNVLTHTLFPL